MAGVRRAETSGESCKIRPASGPEEASHAEVEAAKRLGGPKTVEVPGSNRRGAVAALRTARAAARALVRQTEGGFTVEDTKLNDAIKASKDQKVAEWPQLKVSLNPALQSPTLLQMSYHSEPVQRVVLRVEDLEERDIAEERRQP